MSVREPHDDVKRPRLYDATGRRARSRERHATLLDAALARFLEHGYTATTIDSIADDAGVSAATIYKTYANKAGVVRALCERALRGRGAVPAEQRSDALQSTESDARTIIEGWGRLTAEVSPQIAPILLLLRDAADGDAAAAALLTEQDTARLVRMTHNARSLIETGQTRPRIGVAQASDILWTYSSPELYDLLVRRRRWSLKRYSTFIVDAIAHALL
jgi:AcrR family transcriptional regulator